MGRFWLKLSGAELAAAAPATRDALLRLVSAAMSVREDRLVWGSGQPPASCDPEKHLDTMIGMLREVLPDTASRSRVLWSNPAALYHF
jgi:predicted TIM-barrel fold metal-dependent hydrolase